MRKIKFLLFLLLIFLFSSSAFAKEESTVSFPTPTTKQTIEYELPYPGLLPDNPLYKLKVLRDKAIGFLISNPLKKAEFNLLQADKRLNAGISLFDNKKIDLAISTISKAENYFGLALENAKKARGEKMDISEIARKLIDSSKKHREVLDSLEKRSPQNFKTNFKFEQKRVVGFEKEANSLR